MKTFLWIAFVSVSLVGCIQQAENRSTILAANPDHEAEAKENCFSSLVAGPVDDEGRMSHVAFVNGGCKGKSKALNLLVQTERVVVYVDGEGYETQLYIKGDDVLARVSGETFKVATLSDNPADAELTLAPGAKASLAIKSSGGTYRKWSYGDEAQGEKQIRIYL